MQILHYGYMMLLKTAYVVKKNNKKPPLLSSKVVFFAVLPTNTHILRAAGPSHAATQTTSRTHYIQLIINTHPELS